MFWSYLQSATLKDWIIVFILIIAVVSVLVYLFTDTNSSGMLEEGFLDNEKKNLL